MRLQLLIASVLSSWVCGAESDHPVEVFAGPNFPNSTPVYDFHCDEANVFKNKVPCVVHCEAKGCNNAVELCKKYKSEGCGYVFLRVGGKRAVLKRLATDEEIKRLNLDKYKDILKVPDSRFHDELHDDEPISLGSFARRDKRFLEAGNKVLNDARKSPIVQGKRPFIPMPNHCSWKKGRMSSSSQWDNDIWNSQVGMIVVNYRSPFSLLNSLLTWQSSGLLDMVDDKIAILSEASDIEIAICKSFGLRIVQPSKVGIPSEHKLREDALSIGAAFYYGLQYIRNDYVLFLESDFSMDTELSKESIYSELLSSVVLLERGSALVRLSSRKNMGTFSFHDCRNNHKFVLANDKDALSRRRNWYNFYCPTKNQKKNGMPFDRAVTDCLTSPKYKCFTSRDSNWSLNACMIRKSSMLNNKYKIHPPVKAEPRKFFAKRMNLTLPLNENQEFQLSIPEIAQALGSHKQDAFEDVMLFGLNWGKWDVPLCLAEEGLFIHSRIDARG